MSIFMTIFLGIVQGITEFLPISSSGHLSILQNFINLNYAEQDHLFFDVLLHLGTLVSICIFYRKDLYTMVTDTVKFIRGRRNYEYDDARVTPSFRLVLLVAIATLPLLFVLPLKNKIESLYYNTTFIGFALIITGALLFVSDKLTSGHKTEKNMTVREALIVGIVQAIAIIPGLSRSGTTISTGLASNLNRDFAVRFSFLLSIPAVLGATFVSFISALKAGVNWALAPMYLIGFIVSAVVGYFSLGLIRKLIADGNFGKFSYYCWIVGALTIILSLIF